MCATSGIRSLEAILLSSHNIISHSDRSVDQRERADIFPGDRHLVAHLQGVTEEAASGLSGEYRRFTEIVCGSHDIGKGTSFFQAYVRGLGPDDNTKSHAPVSALACYRALRNDGFSVRSAFGGLLAVYRHHRPLINTTGDNSIHNILLDDSQYDILKLQARDLCDNADTVQPICDELGVPLDIEIFSEWIDSRDYLRDLLQNVYCNGQLQFDTGSKNAWTVIETYSRLVAADKIDAAQYDQLNRSPIPADAVSSYIEDEFGEPEPDTIDELRNEARMEVRTAVKQADFSKSLFELTLPTGAGKTLTSLDAALILRNKIESETGSRPRIVYTVPYTSIIDQNVAVFNDVLSTACDEMIDPERLLKHHYLSDLTHVTDDTDQNADRALMLTARWESELIATTFVQFLESLIVPSNRQSMKLPNLEDAVVIIDEVQAVPAQYWDVVREVLNLLAENFNCTIIAMSATQPRLFETATPLVGTDAGDETDSSPYNTYFERLDRVSFQFDESITTEPVSHSDLSDQIATYARSHHEEDCLVVCNTIQSATTLFEELSERPFSDDTSLVYLSSAVRPKDRKQRIERLRESTSDRFIVVSTQVVEAGVDIDMDAVWRDFAPLDSIVQAAGRCNREWDDTSRGVITVVSIAEDGDHPAHAIYDMPRLDATRRILTDSGEIPYEATEYEVTSDLVDSYFDCIESRKKTNESLTELQSWQFEDAEIALIDDTLTAEVFVMTEDETDDGSPPPSFTAMQDAVKEGDRGAIARAKPAFYDNVVTVNLYAATSNRADEIQSLPFPDTDLGVYLLNADSPRYSNWYDSETGFAIPSQ